MIGIVECSRSPATIVALSGVEDEFFNIKPIVNALENIV